MTYATLMVQLELGHSNAGLLQIAGDLAERFGAGVTGIVACQPIQIVYGGGYYAGDLVQQDYDEIEKEMAATQAEFRAALTGRARLDWRQMVTYAPLADYLAHQARSADLLITYVDRERPAFDPSRHVNLGDLVMQAGRPVLVVPHGTTRLPLERALVGWKDTREARRAIADALPLLKQAGQVVVAEIVPKAESTASHTRLEDVTAWLKLHGVAATALTVTSTGDQDVDALDSLARDQKVDLIVAGAYGHSRLRELVLGGVTRDLLLCADQCALVSH